MATEKEEFITKRYIPTGEPLAQNDHTLIYRVKCVAEPGTPTGVLKMYRKRNIVKLYEKLMQLDYSEWPHIYNVKYFDDSTLVVEEYLQGDTLQELMDRNRETGKGFSEEEAGTIMEKLCDVVDALAKLNPPITHHNLKPSNIFVTKTGAIKLLDFVPKTSRQTTSTKHVIRTLGSIFYKMLTGRQPKGKLSYHGRYAEVIKNSLNNSSNKGYQTVTELNQDITIAKNRPKEEIETITYGIPYTLTVPFQGIILSFEWFLFYYFYTIENTAPMWLFAMAFAIQLIVFIAKRHIFLKKCDASLGIMRRAYPFVILGIVLFVISFIISTFIK
ncbi:MAG: hypothetical protein J5972_07855 [Eubacterium sp.]|nr:hypothetical protein [Eubacterium sp.]